MSGETEQDGAALESGAPVSERFDDPYFSKANGLGETRHVFLMGNDLPERWRGRTAFSIAELGFGTGLNFCAALRLWRETAPPEAHLTFTSFEAFPLSAGAMERALSVWPELRRERVDLISNWRSDGLDFDDATLRVIVGDARGTLERWDGCADAWFLDGFAPARNPELWEPALMEQVAAHTAPQGTFATYTAAGFVRRRLEAAGFAVEKRNGYGRKREMSAGRLKPPTHRSS